MEDFIRYSIKTSHTTIMDVKRYLSGMSQTAIHAYNNQKLVSFMISLPIIGGLFRAAIIFYCKALGYHPFIHVLTIKDYFSK